MQKTIAYPGSYYDYAGFETWLSDRSAEGFRLDRFGSLGNMPVFEVTEEKRLRYFVLPMIGEWKDWGETQQRTAFTEAGWEFVCEKRGIFTVYMSENLWAAKPFVKPEKKDYDRQWRGLLVNAISWPIMMAFTIWKAVVDTLDWNFTYYERITGGFVMVFLTFTVPVLLAMQGCSCFYDLYVWKRTVRQKEKVGHWNGMTLLRWSEVAGIGCAILSLLICVILLAGGFGSKSFDMLSREKSNVPMVTLELLEDNVYYAPEGYPGTLVNISRSLLVPKEVTIESGAMYEEPEKETDWIHLRPYDTDIRLRFSYYQLLTKRFARNLAQDEAGEAVLTPTESGFDQVWIERDEGGRQYITALEGDAVITLYYTGSQDLLDGLPEIYEIVMDYRNS